MDEESRSIEFSGSSAHYYVYGPADGQPMVFLHGKRLTARGARDVFEPRLTKTGLRVIHVDIPGCGETPTGGPNKEDWLAELIDALGVSKPIVVSGPMGGPYSLPFVTSRPDQVLGFVAIALEGVPDYADSLGSITVPVLALWGRTDGGKPDGLGPTKESMELLARTAPNVRTGTIPGKGACVYRRDVKAFIEHVLEFVRTLQLVG